MKNLLLLLIFSFYTAFTAFRGQAQAIQGSIKLGSDPKEIIVTIRNNSGSPVTGNVTKVMFTLLKNFNSWATPNGFGFQNIYTLPLPSTGSFSNSSFSSMLVNYLTTTWTGSKAIDLDPGESMDLFGFSLSVETAGYPDSWNNVNSLLLYCVRSTYMPERKWLVEVDGVDLTTGNQDLFYSTGPSVTTYADPPFIDSRTAYAKLSDFTIANLPVKLKNFEAKSEGRVSQLSWSTSEEINSEYFGIEHSLDAKTWKEVGRVASFGESREQRDYTFNHTPGQAGMSYYRLKMMDLDKTHAYSQIVNVKFNERTTTESVYPNPVLNKFQLTNSGLDHVVRARVYDVSGKLVYESSRIDQSGISIGHLGSGKFYVELENSEGNLRKYPILKK